MKRGNNGFAVHAQTKRIHNFLSGQINRPKDILFITLGRPGITSTWNHEDVMVPARLKVGTCRVLQLNLFDRLALIVVYHGNGWFTLIVDEKISIHSFDRMEIRTDGILRIQKDK